MQQQFQCPVCKYPVPYGSQFCSYCGTPFTWQQEATVSTFQQQPPQYDNQQSWQQQYGWNQVSPEHQPQAWDNTDYYQPYFTRDDSIGISQKKPFRALLLALLLLVAGTAGFGLITSGEFAFSPSVSQTSTQPAPAVPSVPPVTPNQTTIARPALTLHDITATEIESNSKYWNISWQGKAAELQKATSQINQLYLKTHTYIKGETDCNDMVIDIWNMLQTAGITSIIVAGNLDFDSFSFTECNHAWLLVYSIEKGETRPKNFILESTNGRLYFSQDAKLNPQILRYQKGFFYTKPSDFKTDFKERW